MEAREFGRYLKGLRNSRKLTIRQLDTYSGVSNSYISQMERGERGVPKPDILMKLAKPLGVSYEELMEKAGYISRDEVFKEAVHEGIFNNNMPSGSVEVDEFMDQLINNPDKILSILDSEDKNELFSIVFNDLHENQPDFLNDLIQRIAIKNAKDNLKALGVVNDLGKMSETDLDEVIDFIRWKTSKRQ